MGLEWGDNSKPPPDWVYVLIAVLCLAGIMYGLASE